MVSSSQRLSWTSGLSKSLLWATVIALAVYSCACPRPPRQLSHDRAEIDLLNFDVHLPATVGRQTFALREFEIWLSTSGIQTSLNVLLTLPCLVSQLLVPFGLHLFNTNRPMYIYSYALTAVQKYCPDARNFLHAAKDLAAKWRSAEPQIHRIPLPYSLWRAMISLACSLRWFGFAAATYIAFKAPARIGEVLRLVRSNVVLPTDLLQPSLDRIFVCISAPKSRHRGGALVQHVSIVGNEAVVFLTSLLRDLAPADRVYPLSASAYRRRWDELLKLLAVREASACTPGSLRGGGAVHLYMTGMSIQDLVWRMRLKQMHTLSHYVQEVAALASLASQPQECREAIKAASSFFDFILLSCSQCDT